MKSRHHRDLLTISTLTWGRNLGCIAYQKCKFVCQCCQLMLSMMLMLSTVQLMPPLFFIHNFHNFPSIPSHKQFCYENVIFLFTILGCWCFPVPCQCSSAAPPPQRICCNMINTGQSKNHCSSSAKLLPLPARSAVHLFLRCALCRHTAGPSRKPWMGGRFYLHLFDQAT